MLKLAKAKLKQAPISHGGVGDTSAAAQAVTAPDAGPSFPTLGVTLEFLERFVQDKVAGQCSRYCIATADYSGAADDELSFKVGDILAIADLDAANDAADDGWYVGYKRAGDWSDRKKFRPGDVERLSGLTTDEVCGNIIKPETAAAPWPDEIKERSYARMVMANEPGVGTANVFASHAWTFVFAELVESLRFFESQQVAAGQPASFFWLDIFVVDENAAHTYPSEWWQTSFTQAVGTIGHTALVLTPWKSPVPLRRAWCLWEIYSTLSEKATLSVCMSDAEMSSFHRALVEEFDTVITSLCTIDAETAEAGSKKDLDMIFAAVRTLSGGFQTLNVTVMEQMREWLINSMRRALAALGLRFEAKPVTYRVCCAASGEAIEDMRVFELFESPCQCDNVSAGSDVDLRLSFGNWWRAGHGTKEDVSICTEHYNELSRMQRRKWTAVKCVDDLGEQAEMFAEREYELVGEVRDDPDAQAQAASLLIAGNRLLGEMSAINDTQVWCDERAGRKALALRIALYGRNDARTAEAMVEVSKSISMDDEVHNAEEYSLLAEALEIRMAKLPENHPDIADSLKFVGRFFHENHDDHKSALPFYQKALAIYEHNDTTGLQVDTVSAVNDVACAFEDLGMLEEAREYYERAYRCSYEGQGARHSETAAMASNLALIIMEHFRHEIYQAVPLLRLSLKTNELISGPDNPDTQEDRKHLGHTLWECAMYSKSIREANCEFSSGDKVRLSKDLELNKALAKGHGEWEDDMERFLGETGVVKGLDDDGDVRVRFNICGRAAGLQQKAKSTFCFNQKALSLVSKADVPVMTLADVVRTGFLENRGWSGTDQEAEHLVVAEAEALLLRALVVMEKDVEYHLR